MRVPTCIAAGFALLSVAVAPLTANAQFQSQSQPRSALASSLAVNTASAPDLIW